MRFSSLIKTLKAGDAGLLRSQPGADPLLAGAASLELAASDQLSFLEKGNALSAVLDQTAAGALLLPDQQDLIDRATQRGIAFAVFADPRLAFAEALDQLKPRQRPLAEIHPTAVIDARAVVGAGTAIAARVCIGAGSRVGADCVLHPGVVIYDDVVIGDGCELHANAVLHPGSRLGRGCVVNANAVVGSEGFGFVPYEAAALGTPSTFAGFGPLAEISGVKDVPPRWSVDAFAADVKVMLTDPEKAHERVSRLRTAIESSTWAQFAEELVGFIERIDSLPPVEGSLVGGGAGDAAALNAVLSSKTWRATSPLRKLGKRLRG